MAGSADRLPLLILLGLVGSTNAQASQPLRRLPGVATPAITACAHAMDRCITTFDLSTGSQVKKVCAAFVAFEVCFNTASPKCNRWNGELDGFSDKYSKIVLRLPVGCTVSTTPFDFSPSSGSSSLGTSSASWKIVLPGSGNSGGETSGSSMLYANGWQWGIMGSLFCCCCIGAVAAACTRRRRYGQNGGMGGGYPGYGYEDPYAFPVATMQNDPWQAVPIMQPMTAYPQGGSQYSANMPTQFNGMGQFPMTQQGQFPMTQQGQFPMTQPGYY